MVSFFSFLRQRMQIWMFCLLVLVLIWPIISVIVSQSSIQQCIVQTPGHLDLSACSFADDQYYQLDGQWQFFWRDLLISDSEKSQQVMQYREIPGNWSNPFMPITNKFATGYATYRLHVKMSDQLLGKEIAIRVNSARAASNFYINEQKIGSSGKVGQTLQEEIGKNKPYSTITKLSSEKLQIDLEVSNFHYHVGGVGG